MIGQGTVIFRMQALCLSLLLVSLGLVVAHPSALSTTNSEEAATTTKSTVIPKDKAPAKGPFVSCGGHFSTNCKECHPTDPNWCNGECAWVEAENKCSLVVHYASSENKTMNSKDSVISGPATAKPQSSKTGGGNGVSCGGHYEHTCRECHESDRSWCNGDCTWSDAAVACTYKDKGIFAREVMIATNQHRRDNGRRSLRLDSTLTASAQDWADKLANSCEFEHRPLGQWPGKARAENIAGRCEWYPPGSDPVFDNWKNSPVHNVNMLGEDLTMIGVGLGQRRGCSAHCWTSGNQAQQDAAVVVAMYG